MLRVRQTSSGVARAPKRVVVQASQEALKATAEHWHATYLLGHFTVEGGKKYGYQPRKGDNEPPRIPRTGSNQHRSRWGSTRSNPHYSWRKRREKGHNKPLVWSGDSKTQAKQQVRLSTRVKRAGGEIVATAAMNLPKYFYQYRKDHNAPDKANELTRTTEVERAELAVFYEAKMGDRLSVLSKVHAMSRDR